MDKPILLISPDPAAADTLETLTSSGFVQAFTQEQSRQLMATLQPDWILAQPETWGWPMACVDAKVMDYDPLTGLLNRSAFMKRLEARLTPDSLPAALLLFSIDRFSDINDSFGLAFGDSAIRALAKRLHGITRRGDLVARMGGDLFAILVSDFKDEHALKAIAERFFRDLSRPLEVENRHIHFSYSLGVASWPELPGVDALLNGANRARLSAKRRGGHQVVFYDTGMNVDTRRRLLLENHLRYALEKNEIEVWLQPQVTARDETLVGVETLIRWRHPRLGLISPAEFIPIAEQVGLIQPISEYALRQVIQCANRLHAAGRPLQFGINLSPQQFHYPELVSAIGELLQQADFPPELLEIEVVESQAMQQVQLALDTMRQLKALGVRLALDDFGTGYSSLAWLSQFPVDTLKIDQSFVRQLPDPAAQKIIRSVTALAHTLALHIIAEGVENREQARFLNEQGVHILQGYLFGEAQPASAFVQTVLDGKP